LTEEQEIANKALEDYRTSKESIGTGQGNP
jgi:hypothetical protein